MSVTFLLPKTKFTDPSWEPSDCSVIDTDGGVAVLCNYSNKQVAIADTVEEADAFIKKARLAILERAIANPGESEFFINWMKRQIEGLKANMTPDENSVEIRFEP